MRPSVDQQVVFFYVAELVRTRHFYEEILGLKTALDQGTCRIYHVAGQGFVGFCQSPEKCQTDGVILTFVTQEVDAWHTYLVDHGVTVEKEPVLNPKYNIYHFFARDPDGYKLEFQTFLDPSWPSINLNVNHQNLPEG